MEDTLIYEVKVRKEKLEVRRCTWSDHRETIHPPNWEGTLLGRHNPLGTSSAVNTYILL